MTEIDLLSHWSRARWHIIVSQLAPTFLLAVTVWLLRDGLADTELAVRLAAAGILLASGLLGATAQYAAATEGLGVIAELRALPSVSAIGARVIAGERGIAIVRFAGPAIFVGVFVALLWALFL